MKSQLLSWLPQHVAFPSRRIKWLMAIEIGVTHSPVLPSDADPGDKALPPGCGLIGQVATILLFISPGGWDSGRK